MAVATYATDISSQTLTACESGTFYEFVGYAQGTLSTVPETDYFIQNTGCVSSTVKTGLNSIAWNNTTGITVPTDGAVFFWEYFAAPNSLDTFANGGLRCLMGTDLTNFKGWKSGGNDYPPNPYGGWKNVAIDPTITNDYTGGTGGTSYVYIGIGAYCPGGVPGKGAPFGMDALRYGRGDFRVADGDLANGYATFAGMASANDALSARWGLFQAISGGYLWKGLITLGYTNAVDFRDSNRVILIDDCPRVGANFNRIEIKQAGSRVDWTSISFQSLANSTYGTVSKGRLQVVDNADVNISKCTFVGMDTFTLLSATDVLDSEFRGCGIITANGAKLTGTKVSGYEGTADTSPLVWDVATDPDGKLDRMTFTMGTASTHAIEFGTTSPTTMTLRGITFSGYNASNGQTNSAIHIKRTSGDVTIYAVGCVGTVSYKSAGANVTISSDPVTALVNVKTLAGTNILGARVFLKATTGSGVLPVEVTVTITNSGTTATVAHTAHLMATNDKVVIKGASLQANNGVFSITWISADSYSYQMGSSPGSNPTGTIKATYVAIEGTTDSSGNISMSRVFSASQSVVGWVRKSSGAPYYKTTQIGGTISNTTGLTINALMIEDA